MYHGTPQIFLPQNTRRLTLSTKKPIIVDLSRLEEVPDGLYKKYRVGSNQFVRPFAQKNGLRFFPGCFFYELTRSVVLRENNHIIIQDSRTKKLFRGEHLREILGLPYGTRGNVSFPGTDYYAWFIQSMSHTRKLLWGTAVLYSTAPVQTKDGSVQLELF